MIDIIIADDHPIFIDGIKTTLADITDINIAGEALNGIGVLKILKNQVVDVVLLDIRMPEMDGIATAKEIKKRYPHVKIIMLTQFGEKSLVKKCMELGVDGYLLKVCSQQDLINAIKTVDNGGTWFEIHNKINVTNIDKPKLSKREKEVLKFIAREKCSKEIATELKLSVNSVNTYRKRLLAKAGVKNTAGLIYWATKNNLI